MKVKKDDLKFLTNIEIIWNKIFEELQSIHIDKFKY